MRTQVAIIGSGPSGLLLGQLLAGIGVDNVILERASSEHVLARVRAGVLEQGTVDLLDEAGLGQRLHAEGLRHDGISLAFDNRLHRIDLAALTGGKHVTIYGQTEVTRDLMDARQAAGLQSIFEAADVAPQGFDGSAAFVTYEKDGVTHRIDCDFIAGCDGYHGVSRRSVPDDAIETFERQYPFGWLGVLAEVPPADRELVYANHAGGFALCSMRSTHRSRYYVQCPLDDKVEAWSDQRFWDELRRRLPAVVAEAVTTGRHSKNRSRRCAPSSPSRCASGACSWSAMPRTSCRRPAPRGSIWRPATCAICLRACASSIARNHRSGIDAYSAKALARVWKAVRFSWWMTTMLHRFPDTGAFGQRIQEAELDYLVHSQAASPALAENYVGLPY